VKYIFRTTLAFLIALPAMVTAQSATYSVGVVADTFVSSGHPNDNFGSLGGMEIAAPTLAQPRTQMTLLRFDTSALQAAFDADFGAGNWMATSISLTLVSSLATAGLQPNNARFNKIAAGDFTIDLLSNNSWSEGGITWNTLPNILPGVGNGNTQTPLGTFFWDAVGSRTSTWTLNPDSILTQKISGGEQLALLGQPTASSTVGYLINARTLDPALLNVTAVAVPEPSIAALILGFLCVTHGARYCWRKN
jgi:hypothetical protein